MLKGLNPLLSPELLFTLRAMGHGDELAIVDGNYPGLEHARRLVRLDGHHLIPVLDAVLSVLPIDNFVPEAIFRSTVGKDRDALDPVHQEIIACCGRHEPKQSVMPQVNFNTTGTGAGITNETPANETETNQTEVNKMENQTEVNNSETNKTETTVNETEAYTNKTEPIDDSDIEMSINETGDAV